MRGGASGNLSHMGDDEDLMGGAEAAEAFADGVCDGAADAGINFIEDEDGDIVAAGGDALEGEGDAGEFAAGGDFSEGFWVFAGVGSGEELDGFSAGGGDGIEGLKSDGEAGLLHAEMSEFIFDGAGEFRGGGAAAGGEFSGGFFEIGAEGIGAGFEFMHAFFEGAEGCEFLFGFFGEGEDIGDGIAVFFFELVNEMEASLDAGELGGIGFDVIRIGGAEAFEFGEVVLGGGDESGPFGGMGIELLHVEQQALQLLEGGGDAVFVVLEEGEECVGGGGILRRGRGGRWKFR